MNIKLILNADLELLTLSSNRNVLFVSDLVRGRNTVLAFVIVNNAFPILEYNVYRPFGELHERFLDYLVELLNKSGTQIPMSFT